MRKHVIAALFRFLMQQKPNWSEMDVITLIKELFHIQRYVGGSKLMNASPSRSFITTHVQKQSRRGH